MDRAPAGGHPGAPDDLWGLSMITLEALDEATLFGKAIMRAVGNRPEETAS